ncbi:MAG: DUF2283 domain-containing protein [bacterium]|nr:DUF2283 domain-containing protein [bacterium]
MAQEQIEEKSIGYLLKAMANFIRLPRPKLWIDYDAEVDALYVHFEEKPISNHGEMRDDGIILDYKDNRLVGLTILEASHR